MGGSRHANRRRKTRRRSRRQRAGSATAALLPTELQGLTFASRPLSVTLNGRAVQPGAQLERAATVSRPTVSWSVPASGAPYRALLCFDPDAPARSWLHWLVVNCTGVAPDSGDTVMDWEPPSPPTGTHRYYLCLFEHEYPLKVATPKQRGYFNVRDFLESHGLSPLQLTFVQVSATARP